MTATPEGRQSKSIGFAPVIPANVVTDRKKLPKNLESRLQQAWLKSLHPSKAEEINKESIQRNANGRNIRPAVQNVDKTPAPVASSHSNNRSSGSRSQGLKRVRSLTVGDGRGGSSRDLTNTLQNLWMRTQMDSAERSAYSHLPELSSATVGSADIFRKMEKREREMGAGVTGDRALMDDNGWPMGMSESERNQEEEEVFTNGDLHERENVDTSSFVEEDFFRGLEGLQDAFSEMEELLNGGKALAGSAALEDTNASTDESAKATYGAADGEEDDLFNEYLLDKEAEQPFSTSGDLFAEEIPQETSAESHWALEEKHAKESLAKIEKECARKKASAHAYANGTNSQKESLGPVNNGVQSNGVGKGGYNGVENNGIENAVFGEGNKQQSGGSPMELLLKVAKAIVSEDQSKVNDLLTQLNEVASVYGDAQQRLSAYFLEGLLARMSGNKSEEKSHASHASGCTQNGNFFVEGSEAVESVDQKNGCKQHVRHLLEAFEVVMNASPFLTFGQVAANSAILEAFSGESHVHIVDFGTGFGLQWPALLQALAARPGGPPVVRLTAIEPFKKGGKSSPYCLVYVGEKLKRTAKLWGVPFEYHPVMSPLEDVTADKLSVREGEAVAVNCALRLHRLLDNCQCPTSPGSRVFSTFRSLNPKVCTIVEQHTNYNSPFFLSRFYEALYYYSSLFESIDQAIPRHLAARRLFEQQVFGRAIVNVVACEGKDGLSRQEPSDQWRETLKTVGFQPRAVSEGVITTVRALLQTYTSGYGLVKEEGSLLLTWDSKPILVMTLWQPARSSH